MPGFEIYNIEEVWSASRFFPTNEESAISLKIKEHEKKTLDNIQGRTLLLIFLRMSSERKMDLMTNLLQNVRNLRILADILNIFSAVNTKLISYSKISTDSNSLYEQFLQDKNRMLDVDALEESILDSTEWFTTLADAGQINIIISLLRLSGGSIMKKMYVRLIKIFNKRNAEGKQEFKEYKSSTSMFSLECGEEELIKVLEFKPRFIIQEEDEKDYNQDCPYNKKVVEARKQWQASMAKLRKEIETDVQKLNEPIIQRNKQRQIFKEYQEKHIKSPKDSEQSRKTVNKQDNTGIDWIQLLPIWDVKMIFSYLDDKTLHSLKYVNEYWATISKEVMVEKKTRDYINSAIKKSEEFLENLLQIPQIDLSILQPQEMRLLTESTGYIKRMEKQRKTGTAIKKRKELSGNQQNKSLLSDCFREFDQRNIAFLSELKTFPTSFPINTEYEGDKSINMSLSEVVSIKTTKTETDTAKSLMSSDEDKKSKISSSASAMSIVPSIVVSTHDMDTW